MFGGYRIMVLPQISNLMTGVRFPLPAPVQAIESNNMKIKYGKLEDEYLAPLWLFGILYDINLDGTYMCSLVFGHWYVGVAKCRK